jgi:hypothetical protein
MSGLVRQRANPGVVPRHFFPVGSWKWAHHCFMALLLSQFIVMQGHAQHSLHRQQKIWEKRKPFSYSFDYQVQCFCPEAMQGPFRVLVQADTVVMVNDRPYDRSEFRLIMTPDQLFQRAQRYLDRKPDKKQLDFNPLYGFIQSAYFDPRSHIMDDEFRWSIREFTVIEKQDPTEVPMK